MSTEQNFNFSDKPGVGQGTMWIWNLCLFFIFAKAEDALEDVQTEFYLPYSTTEDVDFSLSKPGGFGCYQW